MDAHKRNKPTVLFVVHAIKNHGGASLSFYNLLSAVEKDIKPIIVSEENGPIIEELKAKGIRCIIAKFSKLWLSDTAWKDYCKKFFYLFPYYLKNEYRLASKIAEELSDEDIKIVHSNSSVFTFGHVLAKKLRAKHIWHIREFIDLDFGLHVFGSRFRLRHLINKADARISISSSVTNHWRLKKKNTYTIADAVMAQPVTYVQNRKSPYFLFCAAQITKKKGAYFALEAFAKSGLSEKGYSIYYCGRIKDDYKRTLISASEKFAIQDSMKIFGFSDNLSDLYCNATGFIMASEYEGLGRVTIEAMANGCPVLARRTGGSLDLICDGETGYFFDTIDECAALMNKMSGHDNYPLVVAAQKYANENFTEKMYAEKILKIYNYLLK